MNTLFATVLVAFTLSTSSTSFASAPNIPDNGQKQQVASDPVAFAIEESSVDVIVQSAETPKMVIRVKDSSGNNIVTKTLTNVESGTVVRFNLSQLADGLYRVNVWDGKSTQVKQLELKTASPVVANQEVTFL